MHRIERRLRRVQGALDPRRPARCPACPPRGRSVRSRMSGRRPSAASPEATSTPMKPPPTMTTRAPAGAARAWSRSRCASASVRSSSACSAPGTSSLTGSAPVATRQRLKGIADPFAQRGQAGGWIQALDGRIGPKTDPTSLVPGHRLGEDELVAQIVAQQLLRERRPVVRREWLGPDDQDRPIEAVTAERPSAPNRRNPAADKQDVGRLGWVLHSSMLASAQRRAGLGVR